MQQASGKAPRAEGDFRRVLDDPSIDAVIAATPHHWHAPIAVRALEAGKHVYLEKPAVAADLTKPVRTYRASDKFEVGERVEHPSFGQGVVEIAEPGKITLFFASGRRVLVQSKEGGATSGLTRPKPFDSSNPAGGKPVGES